MGDQQKWRIEKGRSIEDDKEMRTGKIEEERILI